MLVYLVLLVGNYFRETLVSVCLLVHGVNKHLQGQAPV